MEKIDDYNYGMFIGVLSISITAVVLGKFEQISGMCLGAFIVPIVAELINQTRKWKK